MLITLVAGARPNFMKIAPIIREIQQIRHSQPAIHFRLVHTGQHYDSQMSERFFEQLNMPIPHVTFACGGGSDAMQTACIMVEFEKELMLNRPDLVIVVGDVNSTMACSIVAKKQKIQLAHVEAGIRSGDTTMPEEINRLITDSISDIDFTTTVSARNHLIASGKNEKQVHFVGNVMIDSLVYELARSMAPSFWDEENLVSKHYYLLTLHRQSTISDVKHLLNTLHTIDQSCNKAKVIFPVHPRTKGIIKNEAAKFSNIIQVEPQGYHEFIYLLKHSIGIITDSGGITEEATILGVPCVTLRENTERPETISLGTNELIGKDLEKLKTCLEMMYMGSWKKSSIPDKWDGHAAKRIVDVIVGQNSITEKLSKKQFSNLVNS